MAHASGGSKGRVECRLLRPIGRQGIDHLIAAALCGVMEGNWVVGHSSLSVA